MSLTHTEMKRLMNLQKVIKSMINDVAEHFDCFNDPLPINVLSIKYSKRLIGIDDSFQDVMEMLIDDGTFSVLRSNRGARFLLPKNTTWQKDTLKLASTTKQKGLQNERCIKFTKAKESSQSNKGRAASTVERSAIGKSVSCGFRQVNG